MDSRLHYTPIEILYWQKKCHFYDIPHTWFHFSYLCRVLISKEVPSFEIFGTRKSFFQIKLFRQFNVAKTNHHVSTWKRRHQNSLYDSCNHNKKKLWRKNKTNDFRVGRRCHKTATLFHDFCRCCYVFLIHLVAAFFSSK